MSPVRKNIIYTPSLTYAQQLQNFRRAPKNTDSLMSLNEDEQWSDWHHNIILQARLVCAFRIPDPDFDPRSIVSDDDRQLFIEQENYINQLFQKHLNTIAAIPKSLGLHFRICEDSDET